MQLSGCMKSSGATQPVLYHYDRSVVPFLGQDKS